MPIMLTRTICGHELTFKAGSSLIASRPIPEPGRVTFPVSIRETGLSVAPDLPPIMVIEGLTERQADEFLAAFNVGTTYSAGRHWVPETPAEWESIGPLEEGGFDDDDFEAADRARENLTARQAGQAGDSRREGETGIPDE